MPNLHGFVLAAPQSGSGKTVVTQALIRLLFQHGMNVIPVKVGPDYIDPQFLSLAAQHSCLNLDPWAMRQQSRQMLLEQAENSTSVPTALIIEGVMGLFDGAADGSGSTADLASELDLPIVLVVNAAKQSFSLAALVQGFCRFRSDITIAGIILNNVGSKRHEAMLRQALEEHCPELFILGAIPRHEVFELPERHLGLVQAIELQGHDAKQNAMAQEIHKHLDMDNLLGMMQPLKTPSAQDGLLPLRVQKLAVAQDAAFSFMYSGQIQAWRQQGHEITTFSPLNNEAPDPTAEAIFLPGGYPELFADQIANADIFHAAMHKAAQSHVEIHGECGGYMVLGHYLIDHEGNRHKMLGLLPVGFRLMERKRALGYRQATLLHDHIFGTKGTTYKGHEFHYGKAETATDQPLFSSMDARGTSCPETGMKLRSVTGSFVHLIDSN